MFLDYSCNDMSVYYYVTELSTISFMNVRKELDKI
jgi:hypothetical protein